MFRVTDLRDLVLGKLVVVTDEWGRMIAVPHIGLACVGQNTEELANKYFRDLREALDNYARNWRPPKYPFRLILKDGPEPQAAALKIPEWFKTWAYSKGIEIRFMSDITFAPAQNGVDYE